jgi:hypothetical protein
MSSTSTRRTFIFSALAIAALPLAGCGKSKTETVRQPEPYEGQYKNAKGDVVMEIKEGSVHYTNPKTQTKSQAPFSVVDKKLVVEGDVGAFTLVIAPDGSITGLPADIAGGTAPLKKS